jgi:hypothetical protein
MGLEADMTGIDTEKLVLRNAVVEKGAAAPDAD